MGWGLTPNGIDLSVGSILAASAVVAMLVSQLPEFGMLGIPAALLCGLWFGLVNGVLVAFCGLPPFFVTLAKHAGIKILSDEQDAKGSREGGMNVMLGHLTRFPKIDAVFAINDPQAIGSDLAAKQLNRKNIVITSVDGAPDIEAALKGDTQVQASASQDPWAMAQKAVEIGLGIMNGQKPANPMVLMPSTLITRANVGQYKGWTSPR